MLILTRRTNETIFIGDDVQVTITAIQDNNVRIGIDAPRNIPVHREEVYRRIQEEKGHYIESATDDDWPNDTPEENHNW